MKSLPRRVDVPILWDRDTLYVRRKRRCSQKATLPNTTHGFSASLGARRFWGDSSSGDLIRRGVRLVRQTGLLGPTARLGQIMNEETADSGAPSIFLDGGRLGYVPELLLGLFTAHLILATSLSFLNNQLH